MADRKYLVLRDDLPMGLDADGVLCFASTHGDDELGKLVIVPVVEVARG